MATLNELLKRIKSGTLDKTSLDEKVVNFIKPKIQTVKQAPSNIYKNAMASPVSPPNVIKQLKVTNPDSLANKFWRSKYSNPLVNAQKTIERGDMLTKYKQPDSVVQKHPITAFTNASLDIGNTLLKMPTQVGADIGQFRRMAQGKAQPMSDPVKLGTLLGTSKDDYNAMSAEAKRQLLKDIFKHSVESIKPIAVASGLNAPKIVATMTGLGGVIGYGGSRLKGATPEEARKQAVISSGEQFGRAVPMAGLMRFTNPVGADMGKLTADQLAKIGAPKFAQFLGNMATQGGINVAEGIALNPLIDRPAFEDVVLDFLTPGVLDVGGKAIKGATKGTYSVLKNAIRNVDPEGFDSAIKVLKEQGVKFVDDAVIEIRKMLANQRGSASIETLLPGAKKIEDIVNKPKGFEGFQDLSLRTLEKLKGREVVSKQFISDLTNAPDLKQQERDLIRATLDEFEGDKISVKEFADSVKVKLLPLQADLETPYTYDQVKDLEQKAIRSNKPQDWEMHQQALEKYENANLRGGSKYESVSLDPIKRGEVESYRENVYKSPVTTNAGDTHFPGLTDKYFGHSRIEDLPDGATRRVIEVQSDLYQKGNLEREPVRFVGSREGNNPDYKKLQQYNNPTAHQRMIREEIKKASLDGKSNLLFPTGETAMNVEGLVNRADRWVTLDNKIITDGANIKPGDTISFRDETGNVHDYRRFIITENLGEGNFKAVDNLTLENDPVGYDAVRPYLNIITGEVKLPKKLPSNFINSIKSLAEQISAKDTVDKDNQIYKFYEKDVGSYLKNKFGAQMITDPQGVSWWKVNVTPEMGKQPVEAFGVLPPVAPEFETDEEGNRRFTGVRFAPEVTAGSFMLGAGLREIKKGDLDSIFKSINRDADYSKYSDEAKDMIASEAKRLADQVEGVTKIPIGDGDNMKRVSLNPKWYKDFFSSEGRAPNNKELFELAEENLRTGKVDGFYPPDEVASMSKYLDEANAPKPVADLLQLPKKQDLPQLQSPKEIITSKKKLLDVFKKTGVAKDYLNVQRPKTKAIPMGEATTPTYKASTTEDAKRIFKNYGVNPEFQGTIKGSEEPIVSPGQTIEGRQKRIEEILYGSATPSKTDLGGEKEGVGTLGNILRKGITKTSDVVSKSLESENPIIRNTARTMQGLFGNVGKSSEQVMAKGEYKGGIDYAKKLAVDVESNVNKMVDNSPESLERIHSVLDPELATTKVNYEDLTPKEKEATDFLRFVSDFINETNYKNGFISEDKYRSNTGGKYIARAYEPYDYPPEIADYLKQRNISFDLQPFKQRGDVTDWKVENAIRNPSYLVAKRLQQTMFNDNLVKMSNWLNSTELVSDTAKPGFVQMSENKIYGDLSGKYIRKDALEDMRGFFFESKNVQQVYDVLNAYNRFAPRQFRKKLLTVFNPAVRLGNRTGNYIFSWMNGINPVTFKANKNWARKAIKNNDPLYRRMMKDGLVNTDILKDDITRMATELKAGVKDPTILQKIDQTLQDSYGRVDDEAKISAMKTWLDRGYSYEEASRRVYNGFQNYNSVGFLYDIGAKVPVLGNPFVRFKADILRMAKNAVVDHPIRAIGTVMAWQMFTNVMSAISGETAEDKETREGRLGAPRIPFTDVSLAVQTPWGEVNTARLIGLYAMNTLGEGGNVSDITKYAPFESPFVGTGDQKKLYLGQDPLIGAPISLLTDTDFRGKSISDPDSNKYTGSVLTDEEKNKNRLAYLFRSYAPPTVNDVTDVGKAVQGEPNYYGQKRTPLQAMLRMGGVKVEQYGAEEAQLARDKNMMYAQNRIEAEQRKISMIRNQLSRGEVTPEEAEKRITAIQKNIDKEQTKFTTKVAGAQTGTISDTRVKSLNKLFGADLIDNMPSETNYQKAQKKEKQFDLMTKVFDSDFLSDDEKADYISKVTEYKPNEVKYYQVARGSTDERYGFVLDKVETSDDLMKALVMLRYEMNDKRILTNNLVDQLVDDGYISKSQGSYLKKVSFNPTTGNLETSSKSGSGTSITEKTLKALLASGKELQSIFEKQGKTTTSKSTYSKMLPYLNNSYSSSTPTSKSIASVLSNKRKVTPIANTEL